MSRRLNALALLTSALGLDSHGQIPDLLSGYTGNPAGTTYVQVASAGDKVASPSDLDFDAGGNLWVINHGTLESGGSTVKISNPGKTGQKALWQEDGNAYHFMLQPTAIAFGDNGNFATSPGTLDCNHGTKLSSSFSGPSLWTSDPAIYAKDVGGNGSHIDMLHESPYSMGIAHEKDNAYWVFDANSMDVVRYDFAVPHEPGGDDHADGSIRRYPEVAVKWIRQDIPCHLVMQKAKGWLYIVDGGNKRILRLNIATGTRGGTPKWRKTENVKEYVNVTGATWEVVADKALVEPTGVDVLNNTLVVSDHGNGNLVFFDIAAMPAKEIGRLNTGAKGIKGLVIGPDGRIWYVDAASNRVMVAQPAATTWAIQGIRHEAAGPGARLYIGGAWTLRTGRSDSPLLQERLVDTRGRMVLPGVGYNSPASRSGQ